MAEFTRLSQLSGVSLLVWGGGKDGRAAAVHALAHGCTVTMISDEPATDHRTRAVADEMNLAVIDATQVAEIAADFLVRSPGVVKYRPEVATLRERGVGSSNLLALWLADQDPGRIIAVTGTKGKSTTASLIATLLRVSGKSVALAGNIGVPVTDVPTDVDVVVLEVSSYQASDCTTSPAIGALTNLDQDHLQWHGSLEQYHRDKLNLFGHHGLRHLICDASDTYTTSIVRRLGLSFENVDDDLIDTDEVIKAARLNPHGLNMSTGPMRVNTQLAIRVAHTFNPWLTVDHVRDAIKTFEPLPSRQRIVGVRAGITYVDDALASNPHGVIAALDTFDERPLVLIVGGQDRGVDYAPLCARLNSARNVKALVVLGSSSDTIARQLQDVDIPRHHVGSQDVSRAVQMARSLAAEGDHVLFSPGAPTPSELGTYQDRSASFTAAALNTP